MERQLRSVESERLAIEREYLYWLTKTPFLGAVKIRKMWERFQSFECIYNIEEKQLRQEESLREADLVRIQEHKKDLVRCQEEYHRLSEKGIHFVPFFDSDYPERLKKIYDWPVGLYVKGNLPDDDIPTAAVIGARDCTSYGMQVAGMLGRELGSAGIQIVSGLALGIDGAGHQGALDGDGKTFAILGSGVDVCYPKGHWRLYEQMQRQGGVISEFPLGTAPMASHFPMRNRLISGLADVIIVVEAREKSGSLITVEQGLEQGKESYAVPGQITDHLSMGCNQLIQQGAGILTSPDDIFDYFQIGKKLRLREKNKNGLAKNEKMVYSCLDFHPKYIDQVVEESGLPLGEVMILLLELETKGYIQQPVNHYYVKKLS